MLYLTAFITGLLGSFHCLGMCGPIALIAPIGQNRGQFVAGRLVYNGGRIFTYAIIGLLIGAFGQGLQLAGIQQYISIITGVLLLLYAIVKIAGIRFSNPNNTISAYSARIQKLFAKFITKPGLAAQFTVGMINGLLPCGLVYLALAGAATTTHALQGAAFMALFGLGTLPMMLAVSFTTRWVTQGVRSAILKTIPYFVAVVAVLFIIRGMNLGVPYISPKINANNEMECCEKPH